MRPTVVERAVGEAVALGDDQVRPEHVLIALAGGEGPAAGALGSLGGSRPPGGSGASVWRRAAWHSSRRRRDDRILRVNPR